VNEEIQMRDIPQKTLDDVILVLKHYLVALYSV
jgi:hypothetical protein